MDTFAELSDCRYTVCGVSMREIAKDGIRERT